MTYERLYRKIKAHSEENGCTCAEEFEFEAEELQCVDALYVPSHLTTYWLRTVEGLICDEV